MKTYKGTRVHSYDEDGNDYLLRTINFRANKREAKQALSDKHKTFRAFIEDGVIAPYGCDCSHCQMDYDCCGNFFVAYNKIRRVRRGFQIQQYYQRNV